MGKLMGRNSKILFGGTTELPQSNSVSISYDWDFTEARVFQDEGANGPWKDQIPGFKSWKIDITVYYDDSDDRALKTMVTNNAIPVVVYENRTTNTRYWYGSAFFTLSEDINTNDIISIKMSGQGTGPLTRVPLPVYP